MHILLIEPDMLQAQLCTAALLQDGHTVASAKTAQAAIQLADERSPDVVVLELQLARHNGVEFLYEFRSYPEWLRVPVVVCTFVLPRELAQTPTLQAELGVSRILYKPQSTLLALCTAVQACGSAV